MKKITVLLCALLLSIILNAEPINMYRFGFLAPQDASIGSMFGFCYGSSIDNTVVLFPSADLFYRNFSKERKIGYATDNANNPVQTIQKTSDISTYYLPLQLNGKVNIPADSKFKPFVGGGFGLGLLWENVFVAAFQEDNADHTFHSTVKETKFYSGFNWNLQAGVRYSLSRHTAIYGELFYNGGRMKRDIQVTDTGITWNEIDMSGVGLRIGLEVPAF